MSQEIQQTISTTSLQSPSPPTNPLEPIPPQLQFVDGINKLRRAIGKELISKTSNEKCSNLPHYLSIVKTILEMCDGSPEDANAIAKPPSAVLKPFNYIPKKPTTLSKIKTKSFDNPFVEESSYEPPGTKKKKGSVRFIVDIVSAGGEEWFKVSARNPQSLVLLAIGGGGYGQKSIIDHAKEYIKCSSQNQCLFQPPKISFIFACGIGSSLAEKLEGMGINVRGHRIPDLELPKHPRMKPYQGLLYESSSQSQSQSSSQSQSEESDHIEHEETRKESCDENAVTTPSPTETSAEESQSPVSSDAGTSSGNKTLEIVPGAPIGQTSLQIIRNPSMEGVTKLNLDITALLAYVSNLTNGHTYVKFRSKVLSDQLQAEKLRPQKPILDKLVRGRQLFCCQTAYKEFKTILETVGGNEERIRATEFLRRIQVVPDHMSERSRSLQVIGNVKLRSAVIFGTGDYIQAVTVSANSGFVRSAKAQDLDFPVFLHESRALTEQKEIYFTKSFLLPMDSISQLQGILCSQ